MCSRPTVRVWWRVEALQRTNASTAGVYSHDPDMTKYAFVSLFFELKYARL